MCSPHSPRDPSFATERGGPFTTDVSVSALPHAARHVSPQMTLRRKGSCYALANEGHDTRAAFKTGLGTARYSILSAIRAECGTVQSSVPRGRAKKIAHLTVVT